MQARWGRWRCGREGRLRFREDPTSKDVVNGAVKVATAFGGKSRQGDIEPPPCEDVGGGTKGNAERGWLYEWRLSLNKLCLLAGKVLPVLLLSAPGTESTGESWSATTDRDQTTAVSVELLLKLGQLESKILVLGRAGAQ